MGQEVGGARRQSLPLIGLVPQVQDQVGRPAILWTELVAGQARGAGAQRARGPCGAARPLAGCTGQVDELPYRFPGPVEGQVHDGAQVEALPAARAASSVERKPLVVPEGDRSHRRFSARGATWPEVARRQGLIGPGPPRRRALAAWQSRPQGTPGHTGHSRNRGSPAQPCPRPQRGRRRGRPQRRRPARCSAPGR
jgi:hypothetical protein